MLPDNFQSSMSSRNSNNPNGLRPRQQQHRRQNSTPNAFRAANVPKLPNQQRQHAGHGHRRGLSLDIRQLSVQQAAGQDYMVSTHTNSTGLATHSQHLLREAQQQRIQARPGNQTHFVPLAPSRGDQNLISPLTTPQLQAERFDQSCFGTNNLSFVPYGGDINMMMSRAQNGFGDHMSGGREFDLLNADSALSTPTFANFQESPSAQGWTSEGDTTSTRKASRRISNGIMDRVHKFENLGFDDLPRPITPPNQDSSTYFPPTPLETPHGRLVKIEPRPSRFTDGYDESMEETIKPSRGRPSRRAQNIFQDMRQRTEQPTMTLLPQTQSFDGLPMESPDYMNMAHFNHEIMKLDANSFNRSQSEPDIDAREVTSLPCQRINSFDSSIPNLEGAFDDEGINQEGIAFGEEAMSSQPPSGSQTPAGRYSSHRRTQSIASVVSAASIASINIEETKTETGVTMEQIAIYIGNPPEPNGRYKCLYPGCAKLFGRKENIKSHIQTHLGDRQYQCPTCQKCFVRQHDLKRHAKIHTGVKPYPCDCGNTFARHDALTRHRQRGMCVGAFDDLPIRKKSKRGRPPKNRDGETTELRQRKNRTARSSISCSSPSGPSGSSAASTPGHFDFNSLPSEMEMNAVSSQTQNMSINSTAPMSSTAVLGMPAATSSPMSAQSYVSPEAIMEPMSSHPPTPRSSASHFNTPPGLTHSSTPPPSSYLDLDNSTIVPDSSSVNGDDMLSDNMANAMGLGMNGQDDDMLLGFGNEYSLTQLDRDPNMMNMSKFDEEYDGMFNDDSVFFPNN